MQLSEFLDFDAIRVDLTAGNKRQLLNQLAQIAASRLSLDPSHIADSIAERGVLQPILVRPTEDGYELIAGERRWRAAQRAQLHEIPAIIREFDEESRAEIALIENIQRENLNAIEEAEAYRRLISGYGHSQEVVGKLVGKSRSHVANLLRLLNSPTRCA